MLAPINTPIAPGFDDPVHGAQNVFSGLMHAMARPGRITRFEDSPEAPAPFYDTTGALLLTLADYDTIVWFDEAFTDAEAALSWFAFHTGAPHTDERQDAHLAVCANVEMIAQVDQFSQGTSEYPDRSATLIVQVEALNNEPNWTLSGPGIEDRHWLDFSSAPENFDEIWGLNRVQFPLGVDLILCTPDQIVCLPRTVNIERAV